MAVRAAVSVGLALAVLATAPVALGASDHAAGDGSDYSNPALFDAQAPLGTGPLALREPYHPAVNVDWGLGLRGAYTADKAGGRYEMQVLPSVSASYDGGRWHWNGAAEATLIREQGGLDRLSSLRLSTGGDYALDPWTTLSGNAEFSAGQAGLNAPNTAGNVEAQPIIASGGLDGTVTRRFGHFTLALRGSLDRSVSGPTTLTGGVLQDNVDQNTFGAGAGLRLGLAVTPIWTVFVDGQADRLVYDAPSKALLVSLDGTTYALKTGVSGQWGDVLTLEGSVGLALRRFDDASLSDVRAVLYDARAVFRPDPTWTMTASLSSSIGAPGAASGGSAKIDYAALGEVAYQVNRWLSLRGNVGWNTSTYAGTSSVTTGTSLGLGASYVLNAHTSLTADYSFSRSERAPNPAEDSHMVAIGLRLSR